MLNRAGSVESQTVMKSTDLQYGSQIITRVGDPGTPFGVTVKTSMWSVAALDKSDAQPGKECLHGRTEVVAGGDRTAGRDGFRQFR